MTSCGFCQASRAGSSNTCAHFSASRKPCSCVAGDWAARGPATNRSKAAASLRGCRGSGVGSRLMAALTGGTMNGEKRIWSQHVANLARAAFWLLLLAILLLQLLGSRGQDSQRAALLGSFEKERNSRVIAMIHRQESASILGVPVAGSISIDDSEAILRAIRLTPPDQPIDLILHTPGGLVLAAEQIAKALVERKAKVTVFVPHYAMSGGTLIALAADEIVMDANAVLGPVDPVVGDMPAGSIVRMVQAKGVAGVSDQMLVLADVAQMARLQVAVFTAEILRKHHPPKKAVEIARVLSEGRWTH